MSASGAVPGEAEGLVTVPYGTLTIGLNNATAEYKVDFEPAAGVADLDSQTIFATQPCATLTPGVGTLLTFTPNTGALSDTVQIRNNAFGVNTGNTSCGSSAAAVISGTERLKIDLGSALPGVLAESAALNLTRVKSGNLTLGFNGGPQGASIPFSGTVNVTPAEITTTDDLFTSITIGSTSTKAGEGLSVANGTSFELVTLDPDFDVAVDCGEFVPSPAPGDIATSATYERLDNKAQNPLLCEEVGVRVQIQDGGSGIPFDRVFWNNDFAGVNGGSDQNVQAYFTIVWTPTNIAAELDREIDYTGTALEGTPMLWCGPEENGVPTLPTYSDAGAIEFTPGDLRAPWCLVDDSRVLQPDGNIVQTQKLFGSGDPWAR